MAWGWGPHSHVSWGPAAGPGNACHSRDTGYLLMPQDGRTQPGLFPPGSTPHSLGWTIKVLGYLPSIQTEPVTAYGGGYQR